MPKLRPGFTVIGIDEVIQRYKELQPDGKFFDPLNTAFFASNTPKQAYCAPEKAAFFITGESFRNNRKYTVRVLDWETGEIGNIGPFNAYARSHARKIAIKTANDVAKGAIQLSEVRS